jgi:antitoxin MazE
MTTKLIPIGNSRGIRLSKSLIDQYNFEEEVELVPEKTGVLIVPKRQLRREQWEEQIKAQQPSPTPDDTDWLTAPLSSDTDWTW